MLPGGLIALEGTAGDNARDFLEERRWLYKHQYHQTGFRALEKLAASIILHWLLYHVPERIIIDQHAAKLKIDVANPLGDTSSLKGRIARQLLWERLKKCKGEPDLLKHICEEVANTHGKGLPPHGQLRTWAKKCQTVFENAFREWSPSEKDDDVTLTQHLVRHTGITCSETSSRTSGSNERHKRNNKEN